MIFQCNYVWKKKIHTERAAQIGVSFRECHSNPLLTLTEWISHRRLVCLWLWCKAFFFFWDKCFCCWEGTAQTSLLWATMTSLLRAQRNACRHSHWQTQCYGNSKSVISHTHTCIAILAHTHGTKRKRKGKQIDRESIKNNADTRPHCSWPARKLHLRFHFTFKACAAEVSEVKS